MRNIWLAIGVAAMLPLILAGCNSDESSSNSIPVSFSPAVKKAMTAYENYKQTPLLIPTVVPTPSKSSAQMKVTSTADDPSFDKYTYLLSFVETDPSTGKSILPKVSYVTGSQEHSGADALDIFSVFSQYSGPEVKTPDIIASHLPRS